MKVYIVFLKSGKIHSIYHNRKTANMVKEMLEKMYEIVTIKEYDVI